MSANAKLPSEPIRLVFELTRDDHPRLYDDLIRFPKGTKRINRLRVLAYDGLLMQCGQARTTDSMPMQGGIADGGGKLTNDLFGPAIGE